MARSRRIIIDYYVSRLIFCKKSNIRAQDEDKLGKIANSTYSIHTFTGKSFFYSNSDLENNRRFI